MTESKLLLALGEGLLAIPRWRAPELDQDTRPEDHHHRHTPALSTLKTVSNKNK